MKNFLLLAVAIGLVGCGAADVLPWLEKADDITEGGAQLGIPYLGVANMLTGVLVEFVRGRLEKKSLLKHTGALYRGVDAHLKTLSPEEAERGKKLMETTVEGIIGSKRLVKAKKILDMAKTISKGA